MAFLRRLAGFTSPILGLIVWLLLWLPLRFAARELAFIDRLFLLAPLAIVPLGLRLISARNRAGEIHFFDRAAIRAQPVCAALVVLSFLSRTGIVAAILTIPWLSFGGVCAVIGLVRVLPRGLKHTEELCLDFALLYLPVGCVWLVLSRLGANPLGFSDDIVLLTAVHFHYAGFAALTILGMIGRLAEGTLYRLSAWGAITGIPLLAVGITFSSRLEIVAALLLAVSLAAAAGMTAFILPRIRHRAAKALLTLSAVSLAAAMLFAGAYALGKYTGHDWLDIPRMTVVHGLANSIGFALCGLVGWNLLHPVSRRLAPGVPFSSFGGTSRIGPNYFDRIGAVLDVPAPPTGLVDNLDEYRRPDFDTSAVHPDIRAFYERTSEFGLLVVPDWKPGFRLGARLFRHWAERAGQLCLPLSAESQEFRIASRIFKLDDRCDGRTNVRAWIRTYTDTDTPVYVAAYATHTEARQTYMNIAFPLPRGNLASILRLEALPGGNGAWNGVLLSTLGSGDEGVYFANRVLPVRLPLNETIRVWTPGMAGIPVAMERPPNTPVTVVARHDLWLFGMQYLTLDYYIFPTQRHG